MNKTLYDYVRLWVCGMFMGIAGIVPGLSSGTIAVIAGVYKRMIDSLDALFKRGEKKLIPLSTLLVIFGGIVMATFMFASLMARLIDQYQALTSLFFMGLIIGTTPSVAQHAKRLDDTDKIRASSVLVIGIAFAFVLFMQPSQSQTTTVHTMLSIHVFIVLFTAGFLAGSTAVIPGFSGSLVLLMLGVYATLMHAISNLNWSILLTIALGALFGVIGISRLMHQLIKAFPQATYAGIAGCLFASAYTLWPGLNAMDGAFFMASALGIFLIGTMLALTFGGAEENA